MSTQSFLFLFFLAAMVVLSTITTPAIAGDDLQEPLSHRCRKKPPTPAPSPASPDDDEAIFEPHSHRCRKKPPTPAPSPSSEFIPDDDEAIFEPLRHKHKPSPAPSPASEFVLEDAELEVVEEEGHEINKVVRLPIKPPTKAPVQPPKAPVQPPKAPVQPPQSQPLRHRKDPPSPSPAPSPKKE